MSQLEPGIDDLLRRAGDGDLEARERLLLHYRDRLKRMVRVRMDRRITGRIDPSDIIQEALYEASQKLPGYLELRPIPFYPWLRRIAWEKLIATHDRHVRAQKRSVSREQRSFPGLPDDSVAWLVDRLVHRGPGPRDVAILEEVRGRVRAALERLPARDCEVLVMYYLEEMSKAEIAAALELTEAAVKSRHRRALQKLLPLLADDS